MGVGNIFSTKCSFKEAITTYGVHYGRNLKFTKNDKKWLRLDVKRVVNGKLIVLCFSRRNLNNIGR